MTEVVTAGRLTGLSTVQPVAVLLAGGALVWYLRAGRRLRAAGQRWPRLRTCWWTAGLLLALAVTCGPVGHYARFGYWVWVSQSLTLLLVVPLPLMCGRPIELARAVDPRAMLARLADTRAGRWCRSPLLGPALVPVVCVLALFGPVPGWAAGSVTVSWLVQLLLVLIGSVIVLPLVTPAEQSVGEVASSLLVGAAVAIGVFELLIDAAPGIVLRLSTHPVSGFFDHRPAPDPGWSLAWLHDQQIGGGVLWCVAELLDLPFLVLVFARWVRVDEREAAVIDAALDQAALAQAPVPGADPDDPPAPEQPWFVNDPRLRDRLR